MLFKAVDDNNDVLILSLKIVDSRTFLAAHITVNVFNLWMKKKFQFVAHAYY